MPEIGYTKGRFRDLMQSGRDVMRPPLEMLMRLRGMRRRGNKNARIILVERVEMDGARRLVPMISDRLERTE